MSMNEAREDNATERDLTEYFHVDIVEATTKEPFLQHRKDGNTYVEVEPDTEYFVLVRKVKELPAGMEISIKVKVDDQCLGWAVMFHVVKSFNFGLCTFEEGTTYNKALKFCKLHESNVRNNTHGKSRPWTTQFLNEYLMGNVQVQIYEYKGTAGPRTQISSNFVRSETVEDEQRMAALDEKKVVTGKGSKKEITFSGSGVSSSLGRQLGCIELKYCTVKGLMAVGVVPPCPRSSGNNSSTVINKRKQSTSASSAIVAPTKKFTKRIISQYDGDEEVEKVVEYDFYDLTQTSSRDDEVERVRSMPLA